jgi:hypothetical protein
MKWKSQAADLPTAAGRSRTQDSTRAHAAGRHIKSVNKQIYALLMGNERRGLLGNDRLGSPAAAFRSAFAAEARGQRLRIHEHVEFTHTHRHTHAHAFLVDTALAGKPRCSARPHRPSSDGREWGRKMATTWSSFTMSAAFSCRVRGQRASGSST